VGVRVQLRQHDLALALGGGLLEHGRELAAGRAPLRPEVDHHRQRARPLDHLGLEVLLGDIDHHGPKRLRNGRSRQAAPAILAASSMGAHTLLRLALDAPDRVIALALITPGWDPAQAGDEQRLARWDALADGLQRGGVEGFIAAYGEPNVAEPWRDTLLRVLRQRMSAHEHPDAVADALRAVPRSAPFTSWEELETI